MPQQLPAGFQFDEALSKQMGMPVAVNPTTGKRIRWNEGTGPKLTEDQGKTQDYAREMALAERQYLEARRDGFNPRSVRNAVAGAVENLQIPFLGRPLEGLAPLIRDDQSDKAMAAERAWLNSRLKSQTGAGQNALEAAEAPRTYFPQFGEGDDTIGSKYELRKNAYEASKTRAGPAGAKLSSDYPNPTRLPGRGQPKSNGPIQVNSPEEAARLPPGTVFLTPDGRQKVR